MSSNTIKIEGFIYAIQYDFRPELSYAFSQSDTMGSQGWMLVSPHTIQFDVPATFNPVAAQVEALEKEREKLNEAFHKRVAEINDKISKLTCIEFSPAEPA